MDNLNQFLYIQRREFWLYQKLKNDKASGEDGIINEYIKSTAHQFINIYEKLFNLIFDCGIIPESWVIGKIKPIYKNKGDSSEPKNYRPITILSCSGKLFTSVLCNRLCTYSNTLLYSLNIKPYGHIKPFFCWLCTFVFHNTLACVCFYFLTVVINISS
jgi:hypothetical protein